MTSLPVPSVRPLRLRKLLGGSVALLGAGLLASDLWHYGMAHPLALDTLHALKAWISAVAALA